MSRRSRAEAAATTSPAADRRLQHLAAEVNRAQTRTHRDRDTSQARSRQGQRPISRFFCRRCRQSVAAELPPAGWLRVQVADPALASSRATVWTMQATSTTGLFCGVPCLAAEAAAWAATAASGDTG